VQGLEPLAAVVATPRRLAVDSDEVVPVRPQRRNPAFEAASRSTRLTSLRTQRSHGIP
jgi:hypothetical protein